MHPVHGQLHELLRILHRQQPQEHLIDECEDGGVGADAERHRQNRDGREAGMVPPGAKRKPEIGEQMTHVQPFRVALDDLGRPDGCAKDAGLPPCRVRRTDIGLHWANIRPELVLGTVPGASFQVPGWVPSSEFRVPSRDSGISTDSSVPPPDGTSCRTVEPSLEPGSWNPEPSPIKSVQVSG